MSEIAPPAARGPKSTSRIDAWGTRKRTALDGTDIVFLDPDNGLGDHAEKHATYSEVHQLRRSGRAVVFIKFPSQHATHDAQLRELHQRLKVEASAKAVITLRTNVSVPRAPASRYVVQRQRWFTVVDPDAELIRRAEAFAMVLASIPRVSAQLHYAIAEDISA